MILTTLPLMLASLQLASAPTAAEPPARPAAAQPAEAQRGRSRDRDRTNRGPLETHEVPEAAGIAWFGTWEAAKAEAKRTGRPILFMSAAPQCQSVPGVW